MAESDFSWLKLASFFGAGLLWVLAVLLIATGIRLITADTVFYGVATIVGGIVCIYASVLVYKNYQKKSLERRK